jgi:hypothetical protein
VNIRPLIVALALVATIAIAAPAVSGAASTYKSCSGSFGPQGQANGGFYRKIRAKAVPCSTARSVTKAWVVAHKSGSTDPTKKSVVKGYSCTGAANAETMNSSGLLKIVCVREGGKKAVRFEGSP